MYGIYVFIGIKIQLGHWGNLQKQSKMQKKYRKTYIKIKILYWWLQIKIGLPRHSRPTSTSSTIGKMY